MVESREESPDVEGVAEKGGIVGLSGRLGGRRLVEGNGKGVNFRGGRKWGGFLRREEGRLS